MDVRARRYGKGDYEPSGDVDELFPGTYYLVKVDALHRRTYARKPDPTKPARSPTRK